MKTMILSPRLIMPALLAAVLTWTGCGKKEADNSAPSSYDGTVTWTHNGKTSTSTIYSSAIVDSPTKLNITASQNISEETVSLVLYNLDTKGVGTYELKKGSELDDLPVGAIRVGDTNATTYLSLYAGNSVNGTIKVTAYDKAKERLEGTFSFTGSPAPSSGKTGTQSVTNGSFSFTHFR